MVLTKGLVVDVATNHGRAHYPVGSWLGIVVVGCGGEDGREQPIKCLDRFQWSKCIFFK